MVVKEVSVILVEGDETLGLACVPCVGLGQPLVGSTSSRLSTSSRVNL
jgi:hypothetical protein